MAKMTKAQAARLHDLQMMVFSTRDMIYRAVPRNDVPFSDCLAAAPEGHQEMHAHRVNMLAEYEAQLVAAGRGYRNSLGHFTAY